MDLRRLADLRTDLVILSTVAEKLPGASLPRLQFRQRLRPTG